MSYQPRILKHSLMLLALGLARLTSGQEAAPVARDYNVAPIPLAFPDDEEELPAPPAPQPIFSSKPAPADELPGLQLAPPRQTDPFSRPKFDPFDDSQFQPRSLRECAPQSLLRRAPDALPLNPDLAPATGNELGQDRDDTTGRQTVRERYANGAVKIEREMIQDADGNYILDGSWRWFSEKGQLIAEGTYVRDQRQGTWRRTFAANDAPLFRAAPYSQFQAPFFSEVTFVDGKLDGVWTIYDSQHRKVSDIAYEKGLRHGPAMWWQSQSIPLIQSNFERGEIHGDAFVFDSAGKIARRDRYEQGWKVVRRSDKHPNGKAKEVSSWLGGHWKLATEDDWWNARISSFEVVDQAVRHGAQVTYFPNGQIQKQQEFNKGKPVGEVATFHENGQRALTGHFNEAGQPDGSWTWWHANGLRSIAGDYLAGNPTGDWTWWNADGKITRRGEQSESPLEMPVEVIATSPGATTLGRPRPAE